MKRHLLDCVVMSYMTIGRSVELVNICNMKKRIIIGHNPFAKIFGRTLCQFTFSRILYFNIFFHFDFSTEPPTLRRRKELKDK